MAYEDLTTFTEVDPSSHWAQTATRNTYTTLSPQEDSYVYKDYGVSYFGNFTHYVDYYYGNDAFSSPIAGIWAVCNTYGSRLDMSDYIRLYSYQTVSSTQFKIQMDGTTGDTSIALTQLTSYYLSITRTGTSAICKIYPSSSDRENNTNIIDTLTVTCALGNFRYLEIGFSYEGGAWSDGDGYIENLNLAPLDVIVSDTINISDEIEINLSREKAELADTIILSDEIYIFKGKEQELEDTITLSDDIELDVSKEHLYLDDVVTLSDELNIYVKEIFDIDNDFRTVMEVREDIPNKINTALRVVNQLYNVITMAVGKIYDMDNDIRTRGLTYENILNDFRMRQTWQIPGNAGFESLGRTYLKVYIGGQEQTDIDIDSITINQILNGSHNASFILGRPYDATRPTVDASISIKYHTWTLYNGYITSIVPGDSPDSIRVNCQDDYWKNNRTKKYFFVGHKPQDNKERYYSTISQALSSELGINFGIGNFVPQTINLFGTGSSDSISNLVTKVGNFAWFYNIGGNPVLWQGGRGSTITLEAQELDKNIGLYQVLQHKITESVENIINRLRVIMGESVTRLFYRTNSDTGQRETVSKDYENYRYKFMSISAYSDWDKDKQILAKDSVSGYGFDHHSPSQNNLYKNVFRRYRLPSLDEDLEAWTDVHTPGVYIELPWVYSDYAKTEPDGKLREGFTIDYLDGILMFNEPVFIYKKNEKGEIIDVREPKITLKLYKKQYFSKSDAITDDPEYNNPSPDPEDPTHPMRFVTNKVGTYPTTVTGTLQLGGLGVQIGGFWENAGGVLTYVPSWNDRPFAEDLAYWELSKTAYKKTLGSIQLTLDAMVYYNIDLSKRINIPGVLSSPLNIKSITYNIRDFTASIELESHVYYKRSVSLQSKEGGGGFSI